MKNLKSLVYLVIIASVLLSSIANAARYQNISGRALSSPKGTAEPNDTVDFDYFFFAEDTLLWDFIDYTNGEEFIEVSKIVNLTSGDYDTTAITFGFRGDIDILASDSIAIFLNDTSETPIKTANYFYRKADNEIGRIIIECLAATATIEIHAETSE